MPTTNAAKKTSRAPAVLLKQTPTTTPAPGYRDQTRVDIETTIARWDKAPADDEYLSQGKDHSIDFSNVLLRGNGMLWGVCDDFEARFIAKTTAQAAALAYMKGTEKAEFLRQEKLTTREEVLKSRSAEATALAKEAVETGKAFALWVSAAVDDWYGPRALASDGYTFSIENLHREARLEQELRLMRPSELLKFYKRLIERGENQKVDEVEHASVKYLTECRDLPPSKLAERWAGPGSRVDIGSERLAASSLVAAFKERREQNEPTSLGIAKTVLRELRSVFYTVFGVHGGLMSAGSASALNLWGAGSSDSKQGDDWTRISPDWVKRRLDPEAFRLPGWSPVKMKTSLGQIVREPMSK